MSFLRWAKTVLYEPKHFFQHEQPKIKGWKAPIQYLVIFSLFVNIFLTIQHLSQKSISIFNLMYNWMFDKIGLEVQLPSTYISQDNFIVVFLVLGAFLITSSFVKYWIVHWFVTMYNKKAKFQDTYKALTFSTTPGWLGMIFLVLSSFLLYFALDKGGLFLFFLFSLTLIAFFSLEIYSIFIRTYGLAVTQKIKKYQAFLSIYVYSAIAYTLLLILIVAMLVGLMITITMFTRGLGPL